MKQYEIYAVIVAGGKGLRMQSAVRKQYIKLAGVPVLSHTLDVFSHFESIQHIVLVVPSEEIQYCLDNIVAGQSYISKVSVVSGGAERHHSVMNGLTRLKELLCKNNTVAMLKEFSCYDNNIKNKYSDHRPDRSKLQIVLIHDGVRPFIDHDTISRCVDGAVKYGACIPVVPVSDTLKRMDSNGFVYDMIDRKNLYHVQTPQAFDLDLIIHAYEHALQSGFSATDDASLVENLGLRVFMTSGSGKNIKITTKDDLMFAEYLASASV